MFFTYLSSQVESILFKKSWTILWQNEYHQFARKSDIILLIKFNKWNYIIVTDIEMWLLDGVSVIGKSLLYL
jgi:hypothetical protein